jgi:TonB-linked SusC/RagA family outer membrane protein
MKQFLKKRVLIILLFLCNLSYSQIALSQVNINGKVVDNKGEPLIGVNVVIKGTTKGTFTDTEGNFALIAPTENVSLKFSYIGYKTAEIVADSKTKISIVLEDSAIKTDEVVVIGYGTSKRSDLTGSISKVDTKELKNKSVRSATDALQGKIAGVSITSTSGSPGSLPVVRIRGIGTINGTDPLYVVDGFPQGDISWLNSSDIESMEVLKDASSTAIYGSRSSNGVIMVTTKKGKMSETHDMNINLDVSYGIQQRTKTYDMMNASEFIDYRNLAYKNGGSVWSPGTHKDEILSFLKENFGSTEGTNWQNEIFRKAPVKNYSLSVSNGSKNSAYYSSLSYMDQDGTVKGADFKRISWNNTLTNQLTNFAKLSANLSMVHQERHNVDENNINTGTIYSALGADPITPVYRTNLTNVPDVISDLFNFSYLDPSNPYSYYSPVLFNNKDNPVAQTDIMHQSVWKDLTFRGGLSLDLDLTSWLKYKGSVHEQLYNANPEYFVPKYYLGAYQNNTDGYVGNASSSSNYLVIDNILTFDKTFDLFGKQHSVFMLGNSIEQTHSSDFSDYKHGLVTNEETQRIIDATTGTNSVSGSKSESSLLSYFGRYYHSWNDRYMLTGTLRYDGSSNFATKNKWALFPSVSVAYMFSEENFIKAVTSDFLSYGKLRLSWGQMGNQVINGGSYLNTYSLNSGYYQFGNAANQSSQLTGGRSYVGNSDVKWETTAQTDLGMDLGFFSNKLTFTFDYFNKKTTDMLLEVPLPSFMGYPDSPVQNAGTVLNTGIELGIDYKKENGDFTYEVSANFSTGKNKVISLGGGLPIMGGYYSPNYYDFTKTEEGKSIGYYYGYKTDGIFQSLQEIDDNKNDRGAKVTQEGARPGDLRYVDVNNDGNITGADMTNIGNPFPDFNYGMSFNCSYKGFDFSMSLYGVHGNDIMNIMKLDFYSGTAYYNAPKDLMTKAWTEANHSNTQFQISTESANNLRVSDWLVENGSYLQIKDVQIGYNLSKKIANSIKMKGCRLWLGVTNLHTFTKYSGMSPEIGDSSPTSSGIDIAFYPQARQYLMGLNVQF